MSNDTDVNIEFSCSTREQLDHVVEYLQFKKNRWDCWQNRGGTSSELRNRVGCESYGALVSWGFNLTGDIEEDPHGGARVSATAWANQNMSNVWITGDDGEISDLRSRFPFLHISGTYKDEYGTVGDV